MIGEFVKERDIEFITIARKLNKDYDWISKISWFDYNFHILVLKREVDTQKNTSDELAR